MTDPKGFLEKKIRTMGYQTCHVLNSSLDAAICAKDCDRLEKHKFAKECRAKGGFYKCCIRRDKAFCHECRYRLKKNRRIKSNFQVLLHTFTLHLSFRKWSPRY